MCMLKEVMGRRSNRVFCDWKRGRQIIWRWPNATIKVDFDDYGAISSRDSEKSQYIVKQ